MPQISFTNDFALAGLLRVFTPFDPFTIEMGPSEDDLDKITLGYSYIGDLGSNLAEKVGVSSQHCTRYYTRMYLMKGTPPTYSQLSGKLSRGSDILVTFYPQSLANPNMWNNDGVNPSVTLQSTDLAYATASGTASWLWWVSTGSSGLDNGTTPFIQAAFTVGTVGSGSDFEMPTTSIVSGRGYKLVNGPTITMSTEFNY